MIGRTVYRFLTGSRIIFLPCFNQARGNDGDVLQIHYRPASKKKKITVDLTS